MIINSSLMQRLLLLTIVLALLLLLGANDTPAIFGQAVIDAPVVFGSISGTVLETTGQPAVGVIVSAYIYTGYSWDLHKTTTTDNTGRYVLDRMGTSTYRVGFSDDTGRYREQYYAGVQNLYDAAEVIVSANQVTGIDATLYPLARIAGTIAVPDGAKLSDLYLYLYRQYNDGWSWYSDHHWYVPSQRQFPFLFGRLESGRYYLRATGTLEGVTYSEYFDNAFSLESATIFSVTAGSTVTNVQIIVGENPLGATLAGRVTNGAGAPLPGISVTAYQTATVEWTPVRTIKTDGDGNYQIRLLAPTLYTLRFSDESRAYTTEYFNGAATLDAATAIMLAPGATVNNVDGQLAPTGGISGLITRFDDSVPDSATLSLYAAVNSARTFINSDYIYRGEDGLLDYNLTGIPAGVYYLRATTGSYPTGFDEYYQDAATLEQATPVTVTAGQTTGAIDFVLGDRSTVATISGRVTGVGDQPLPAILVEAALINGYAAFSTQTTIAGTFQLTVTKPGTYTIRFSDAAGAYRAEYYDDADQPALAAPIILNAGASRSEVNANLLPLGQMLGTVTLYDGTRPGTLGFELHHLVQDEWQRLYVYPATSTTHNAVSFLYKSLSPGVYRLGTTLLYSAETTRPLYYSNTLDFDRATNITITAGATVNNIHFVLGGDTANGRIEGTVLAGVIPLSGIKVELYYRTDSFRWPLLVYLLTDAAGRFRIDGLKRGQYRIGFRQVIPPYEYGPPLFWGGATALEQATIIDIGNTTIADASIDLDRPNRLFLPVVAR